MLIKTRSKTETHIGFPAKNAKICIGFLTKFCFILLREKKTNFAISKIRKFHEKNVKNTKVLRTNYGREIINYDIIKILRLNSQN